MKVARDQPLSVEFIARLWGAELRGTPLEKDAQGLLLQMQLSFAEGRLRIAGDHAKQLQANMLEFLRKVAGGDTTIEHGGGLLLQAKFYALKMHRDEFLRWAVEQAGYPRPTFWDEAPVRGAEGTAPLAARANRVKRAAPTRERVKKEMRADVAAGKVQIDELLKNKEAWAKQYNTRPTTAYEAAKELVAELKT